MQTALEHEFVSVEDYLSAEEVAEIRHEYIGGAVYAMAGTTIEHNYIAQNIAFAARTHLKGKPCKVLMENVKVRLYLQSQEIFYYPDVMIGCDPRDTAPLFLRYPKMLFEVTSKSTERLDRHEKRSAYQAIETLLEYVLVAQDRLEVTLLRRANQWQPEVFNRPEDILTLPSIGLRLSLSPIYDGAAPKT